MLRVIHYLKMTNQWVVLKLVVPASRKNIEATEVQCEELTAMMLTGAGKLFFKISYSLLTRLSSLKKIRGIFVESQGLKRPVSYVSNAEPSSFLNHIGYI